MADQSRLNEKENVDLAQSINEDVSASTVFVSKENSPDESDQSRVEPPEDGETTKAVIEKDMEKPTVASSSSSAAAPAPKGSKESCPACFVNTIDSVLRRITKMISTSSGEDRFIATWGYSAHIIHYLISPACVSLFNRLRSLLPNSNTNTALTKAAASPATPQLPPRLLALSALASETRTTLRILGLFPLLTWASTTLKSPPKDKILNAVTSTQIASILIYQFLESTAYLTRKHVFSPNNIVVRRFGGAARTAVVSVRFWLAYTVLQIVKLARERQLARARRAEKEKAGTLTAEELEAEKAGVTAAKQSLMSSMSWLPLCLHWSFEKGVGVPTEIIGLLCFIAGSCNLYNQWTATADVA